jgi:hypothetical protein
MKIDLAERPVVIVATAAEALTHPDKCFNWVPPKGAEPGFYEECPSVGWSQLSNGERPSNGITPVIPIES